MTLFSVTLRVDEHGRLGVMLVRGELDFTHAGSVVDTARVGLADAEMRRLVVDLQDVDFIDSSGVGALINVYRMAEATGRVVTLRNVGPGTAGVLKMAAVEQLFRDDSPDE